MPVYILGAYAALVPFDDLLTTGAGATLTKLLAILAGASIVFSMLIVKRAIKPSRSLLVLLALVLYIGATIFWAIDPPRALAAYGTYVNYFLLFVAISLYPISPSDMKVVLACMIGGSLAAAGYGDYVFRQEEQLGASRLLVTGTGDMIIDSNEFAAALLAPIALSVMMFLRLRFGFAKLIWLATVIVLFSGFVISGSRGATVGVAAMGIFLLFRSRYRAQLLAISLASVLAIVASPLGERFGQSDMASADGRVDIWRVGIASLHQYWLGGAGVGNFENAFAQYFLVTPHQPLSWVRTAHSMFVLSAVEYGIIGLLLVLAVWYLEFRDLAHVQGEDLVADVCTALRAGILGLFVTGFSLDLMTYKYTWLAFSLVALMRSALLTSGTAVDARDREVREASWPGALPVLSRGT
ncbi:MAG: O-antigen ligase family protein [Burkholderiales bacterium]